MRFRRTRRRSFSKPVARVRNAWSPAVFDRVSASHSGLSELVLFDPQSSDPASETDNNLTTRVRRVLVRGGMLWLPEGSPTPLYVHTAVHVALYVVDADDTDADLLSTAAGSLLTSHRILFRDCLPFFAVQRDYTTSPPDAASTMMYRYDIDQKFNVKLKPDELLVLGTHISASASGVADDFPRISLQCATLFEVS